MAARDKIHDAVKNALVKAGWTITADPFTIQYDDVTLQADLAAERSLEAEQGGRKIVVEVKSFLGASPLHEVQGALGQYLMYQTLLRQIGMEREVYLAIGHLTYRNVFERKAVQLLIKQFRLALLVVDVAGEEIERWIEWTNGDA